jgi:hypothetical protein
MPQRTITGPIVDAAGVGIPSGELHLTPLIPAGESTDGFVVKTRKYPISDGEVAAPVVVPGSYRIDLFDEAGSLLRTFTANISDELLADISLKEIWESRGDSIDVPPSTMREGDSVLRLAPGAGADWLMLSRNGDELLWRTPPHDGDMFTSEYDPRMRRLDVYDRANHTGTQPISSIAGLAGALGLVEYASVCDRKAFGETSGSVTPDTDTLRTLNTVRYNNSGLSDSALLNAGDNSVELLPGRVYVGHANAAAGHVGAHYVTVKSTDGAITIVGGAESADSSAQTIAIARATVDFRIEVPANASATRIQLYQRCRFNDGFDQSLGLSVPYPGKFFDLAEMVIYSRPL